MANRETNKKIIDQTIPRKRICEVIESHEGESTEEFADDSDYVLKGRSKRKRLCNPISIENCTVADRKGVSLRAQSSIINSTLVAVQSNACKESVQ